MTEPIRCAECGIIVRLNDAGLVKRHFNPFGGHMGRGKSCPGGGRQPKEKS